MRGAALRFAPGGGILKASISVRKIFAALLRNRRKVWMGFRPEDFSMDLRKCTAPWKYIWVNSGFSTCALRNETVSGGQGL